MAHISKPTRENCICDTPFCLLWVDFWEDSLKFESHYSLRKMAKFTVEQKKFNVKSFARNTSATQVYISSKCIKNTQETIESLIDCVKSFAARYDSSVIERVAANVVKKSEALSRRQRGTLPSPTRDPCGCVDCRLALTPESPTRWCPEFPQGPGSIHHKEAGSNNPMPPHRIDRLPTLPGLLDGGSHRRAPIPMPLPPNQLGVGRPVARAARGGPLSAGRRGLRRACLRSRLPHGPIPPEPLPGAPRRTDWPHCGYEQQTTTSISVSNSL